MISHHRKISTLALLLLAGAALVLRLAAALYHGMSHSTFGDSSDYLLAAQALCEGTPYPEAQELPFFRAPGYPLFLAVASFCQPYSIMTLKLATITLDLLGLLGVMQIAKRFSSGLFAPLCAGTLYAASPMLIGQTLDLQSETLFQVCLIGCVLGIQSNRVSTIFAAGGTLALAALTRPIALGFVPIALCGILVVQRRWLPQHLIAFLAGMLLLFAPWTVSNIRRTGELILINDAFGYNLWRGNLPIMQRIYESPDAVSLRQLSQILEHELTPAMTQRTVGLTPRQRSRFFSDAGWQQIWSEPEAFLKLTLIKIGVFIRPWLDPAVWGSAIALATGAWGGALYLLALCALVRLWKTAVSVAALISTYLLSALALNLPFQVVARFRVPFYEWVLILLAAYELWRWREEKLAKLRQLPDRNVILHSDIHQIFRRETNHKDH